jgi:hypothetical protein
MLTVPFAVKVEFSRPAFSYAAPTVWNGLPLDVKSCSSVSGFDRRLKTFLFNSVLGLIILSEGDRASWGRVYKCEYYYFYY